MDMDHLRHTEDLPGEQAYEQIHGLRGGGAVFGFAAPAVLLADSSFTNNTSTGLGGVLAVDANSQLVIMQSVYATDNRQVMLLIIVHTCLSDPAQVIKHHPCIQRNDAKLAALLEISIVSSTS